MTTLTGATHAAPVWVCTSVRRRWWRAGEAVVHGGRLEMVVFFRKSPFVFHVYSAIPRSGILSSSHCISLKDKEFPDKLQRGVKRDIWDITCKRAGLFVKQPNTCKSPRECKKKFKKRRKSMRVGWLSVLLFRINLFCLLNLLLSIELHPSTVNWV